MTQLGFCSPLFQFAIAKCPLSLFPCKRVILSTGILVHGNNNSQPKKRPSSSVILCSSCHRHTERTRLTDWLTDRLTD
ncbi:hypothetical protein B0O80DRAFT_260478 [Mortierella sp. GBAus27b]|nr:hypothetical protein B0O80DRAFT_260478 [Mortierella sp. GBAus27b]